MLKSGKFRKITGIWLKLLVWLVVLAGAVIIQSGALRAVDVEASINVAATVNEPTIGRVLPTSGPVAGNTRVTISGTNLSAVIAVTFGGTNAQSFTIDSSESITALTPPGQSGEVKVVVVTADKAAALNNGFSYIAPLSPTTTPLPAATISPDPTTTTGVTATATTATTGTPPPLITTPVEGQITGSPQVSPGPTVSPVSVTITPAETTISPQAVTPGSSPTATITTAPTGRPAITPGTVEISPTSTVIPTPTGTSRPVLTATVPPTPVRPGPSISPPIITVMMPTATPNTPVISPTGPAEAQPSITPTTVSISPSITAATISLSPSTTPATARVSPSNTPLNSATLTPGTPASTVGATGTPSVAPTPTVIVAPTPTASVAPTTTTIPAASPGPSTSPATGGPPVITKISPAAGPALGGTTVIISGVNFTDQSLVTLGGLNPASVTVNSPTQITVVTAPQPAGAVSVVVKTEAGLAPLSNGFTYTAGTVIISQAPTNFNYSGKLTGKVLTLKSAFSVGVSDTTGSGAGWHLVARSTVLSSGKAVIPLANHTIQNVRVVTKSGLPPENKVAYPLTFPTKDDTIFTTRANSGTGESIITFETQLIIPPDIPAGNYTLTLNVVVVAGA